MEPGDDDGKGPHLEPGDDDDKGPHLEPAQKNDTYSTSSLRNCARPVKAALLTRRSNAPNRHVEIRERQHSAHKSGARVPHLDM